MIKGVLNYTKKPVTVQAIQWDGTAAGAGEIIQWILDSGGTARYLYIDETIERMYPQIKFYTPNGPIFAMPEDWVIRDLRVPWKFYFCDPNRFYRIYEIPEIEIPNKDVNSFNNED